MITIAIIINVKGYDANAIKPLGKVIIVATSMFIVTANAAGRVSKPRISSKPPTNSVKQLKYASGAGIPAFVTNI